MFSSIGYSYSVKVGLVLNRWCVGWCSINISIRLVVRLTRFVSILVFFGVDGVD